jgi:hypothetical protein
MRPVLPVGWSQTRLTCGCGKSRLCRCLVPSGRKAQGIKRERDGWTQSGIPIPADPATVERQRHPRGQFPNSDGPTAIVPWTCERGNCFKATEAADATTRAGRLFSTNRPLAHERKLREGEWVLHAQGLSPLGAQRLNPLGGNREPGDLPDKTTARLRVTFCILPAARRLLWLRLLFHLPRFPLFPTA